MSRVWCLQQAHIRTNNHATKQPDTCNPPPGPHRLPTSSTSPRTPTQTTTQPNKPTPATPIPSVPPRHTGYLFNIAALKNVFDPSFVLHGVRQTAPLQVTTRWTMRMRLAVNPLHRWWRPALTFTGVSIMDVSPTTGRCARYLCRCVLCGRVLVRVSLVVSCVAAPRRTAPPAQRAAPHRTAPHPSPLSHQWPVAQPAVVVWDRRPV